MWTNFVLPLQRNNRLLWYPLGLQPGHCDVGNAAYSHCCCYSALTNVDIAATMLGIAS